MAKKKLFCEMGPLAYSISLNKQILTRKVKDWLSSEKFAKRREEKLLPVVLYAHTSEVIKRGPGIEPELQLGKKHNIELVCSRINGLVINPGETFSFWHLAGKSSRRNGFSSGRILRNGKLVSGTGGGLCNLANTLHLLIMNSPMTITELHHHSDALAPDPQGIRVPYSAGTSVSYNYIDLRFRNDTDRPVQIVAYCDGDNLIAEMRTTKEYPHTYRIVEEGHHFRKEENGNYYRISKIYRETIDRATGEVVGRELKWDNRSKVLFDPALLPAEQIR